MLRHPDLISLLQSTIGASILQCQALETGLVHCLLVGIKLDRKADSRLIDKMFNDYGELTFGQLANQIDKLSDVPQELKSKLKVLKKERNWLAHRSWSDTLPHVNSTPPDILLQYIQRIDSIGDNALQLSKQFADILDDRVKKAGVSKEYLSKKAEEIYRRWLAG